MFNPLKSLGDLNQLRKQAQDLQKQLKEEKIEVEKNGVKILITGEQRIEVLETNGADDNAIKEAVNEAIKKAQEVAAKKMQGMMGGMGGLLNQ